MFGGPVSVRKLQHGGRRFPDREVQGVQIPRVHVRAIQRHGQRLSGQVPRGIQYSYNFICYIKNEKNTLQRSYT